ncbi:unnamed protein product, partial [Prorocentrum cordatum]
MSQLEEGASHASHMLGHAFGRAASPLGIVRGHGWMVIGLRPRDVDWLPFLSLLVGERPRWWSRLEFRDKDLERCGERGDHPRPPRPRESGRPPRPGDGVPRRDQRALPGLREFNYLPSESEVTAEILARLAKKESSARRARARSRPGSAARRTCRRMTDEWFTEEDREGLIAAHLEERARQADGGPPPGVPDE